jgi:hypothetical protein
MNSAAPLFFMCRTIQWRAKRDLNPGLEKMAKLRLRQMAILEKIQGG